MNAPSTDAGADPVAIFRPWETEERKAIRRRIIKTRDRAAVRAQSCFSDVARDLYWRANEIAGGLAFADGDDEQLTIAFKALVRLGLSATNFEELEVRHG